MRKNDISTLLSCEIFKGLDENDIKKIEKSISFDLHIFDKNDLIFTPCDFKKALAVILKGSAEVYKERENSAPMLMSIQPKGSVFGIPTLFYDGKDFPTTVRARENCRILFIDKTELEKIFTLCPLTVNNYLAVLSKKIYFLNEKLEHISSPDTKSRLKVYIENTAEENGTDEFILPLSCSELASLLSVGRTSLYRAFDELTDEGFLTRNGKKIKILQERIYPQ